MLSSSLSLLFGCGFCELWIGARNSANIIFAGWPNKCSAALINDIDMEYTLHEGLNCAKRGWIVAHIVPLHNMPEMCTGPVKTTNNPDKMRSCGWVSRFKFSSTISTKNCLCSEHKPHIKHSDRAAIGWGAISLCMQAIGHDSDLMGNVGFLRWQPHRLLSFSLRRSHHLTLGWTWNSLRIDSAFYGDALGEWPTTSRNTNFIQRKGGGETSTWLMPYQNYEMGNGIWMRFECVVE